MRKLKWSLQCDAEWNFPFSRSVKKVYVAVAEVMILMKFGVYERDNGHVIDQTTTRTVNTEG